MKLIDVELIFNKVFEILPADFSILLITNSFIALLFSLLFPLYFNNFIVCIFLLFFSYYRNITIIILITILLFLLFCVSFLYIFGFQFFLFFLLILIFYLHFLPFSSTSYFLYYHPFLNNQNLSFSSTSSTIPFKIISLFQSFNPLTFTNIFHFPIILFHF